MGCTQSKEDRDIQGKNQAIEKQLKADELKAQNEIKLLLLGAGESGKSTILKQMKLIHSVGYSNEDREAHKEVIFSNTVQSMKVIVEQMAELGIALGSEVNKSHVDVILNAPPQIENDTLPKEFASAIDALWKDSGVKACFARASEYQLNDSAPYAAGFLPTDQDILRSRVKTTGIVESNFKIGQLTYKMYDVGGQRSERKKWIHCFENVTAIVFMAAISEYDQKLVEDESVNRLQEALTLFDSICNSRWFVKTSIILFLNKIDLFKTKITNVPLKNSYPEYEGNNDFESASQFLLGLFMALNKTQGKQVYSHFTCATDTTQIKFVMSAVNDIIVQNNLKDVGLV